MSNQDSTPIEDAKEAQSENAAAEAEFEAEQFNQANSEDAASVDEMEGEAEEISQAGSASQ